MRFTNFFYKILVVLALIFTNSYAKKETIELFIFPYTQPGKLIKQHKELSAYLAKELKQAISIVSSRNIPKYIESITKRSHPILLTAPHVGRFAQVHAGYKPVAISVQDIRGYFIVKKNSSMKTLADAKNKILSMAPAFAIVSQIAIRDLKNKGIKVGKNLTHLVTKSHAHALAECIKGKSDLALIGINIWRTLPFQKRQNLRILQRTSKTPGFMVMAHPSLASKFIKKVKKALLKFHASDKDKSYLFRAFKPLNQKTLQSFDSFMPKLLK